MDDVSETKEPGKEEAHDGNSSEEYTDEDTDEETDEETDEGDWTVFFIV